MAFARKLKNMNLFNEGLSYLGEAASVNQFNKKTRRTHG